MIYGRQQNNNSDFVDIKKIIENLGGSWFLDSNNIDWLNCITADEETIVLREEAFGDLMNIPELVDICQVAFEKLETMQSLVKLKAEYENNEAMLYSIKEVELYIEYITELYNRLDRISAQLKSQSFKGLHEYISGIFFSEEFVSLKNGVSSLSHSIANIRSITIGINLNSDMQPYEAGLLAVNDEYFRSGDIIDRFMRMEKKNEMTTLAPLRVISKSFSDQEVYALNMAMNSAIRKTVNADFREWKNMLKRYYSINANKCLKLLPEFAFLLKGIEVINEIKKYNLPICIPQVRPKCEKCFSIKKMYNPAVSVKLKSIDEKHKIVYNDFSFDDQGMIYVLTGPNRGGKSVILCGVGLIQVMFQLGLPVAAESAVISPVDNIFTHFPLNTDSTIGMGKFGEECARLKSMFEHLTEYSIVLMDETLSSTDSYEASAIGEEILSVLSAYGCRGIFATHIHDLSSKVECINNLCTSCSKIDNLVAGIKDGIRTYKIERRAPDGRSYAKDIADKYGLSFSTLIKNKS